MRIKHIVMFRLKEGWTESHLRSVKDGLLQLPKLIPTILHHELGEDLLLPGGQTHPSGKNRLLSWSVTFHTVDDFQIYDQHPAHKSFLADTLLPLIQPGSRAAIQYSFEKE